MKAPSSLSNLAAQQAAKSKTARESGVGHSKVRQTPWKWLPALLVGVTVSLSFAKLPAPPPVDPAKAAEAKEKAAEAAKKGRAAEEAAMDRAVERYKKEKGMAVATTAKPGATAKPSAPPKPAATAVPAAKKK